MAPPWTTNPAPKTESARSARAAFYCSLCQKGYSRINEFEAHEGSYDHTHRKRLKELKTLTRASDPTATARARRAEEKAAVEGLGGAGISIKPISFGGSAATSVGGEKTTGFKKGGFRNAFAGVGAGEEGEGNGGGKMRGGEGKENQVVERNSAATAAVGEDDGEDDDDSGKWGDYDPKSPTGCGPWCASQEGL